MHSVSFLLIGDSEAKQKTFAEWGGPSRGRIVQTFWRNKHLDLRAFTEDRSAQRSISNFLDLKSGLIFTPVCHPDCSSDRWR